MKIPGGLTPSSQIIRYYFSIHNLMNSVPMTLKLVSVLVFKTSNILVHALFNVRYRVCEVVTSPNSFSGNGRINKINGSGLAPSIQSVRYDFVGHNLMNSEHGTSLYMFPVLVL